MCVCVCVCMCACVHVCACACVRACVHMCVCTRAAADLAHSLHQFWVAHFPYLLEPQLSISCRVTNTPVIQKPLKYYHCMIKSCHINYLSNFSQYYKVNPDT